MAEAELPAAEPAAAASAEEAESAAAPTAAAEALAEAAADAELTASGEDAAESPMGSKSSDAAAAQDGEKRRSVTIVADLQARRSLRKVKSKGSLANADALFEELAMNAGMFSDFLCRYWCKDRLKPVQERREAPQASTILGLLMTGDPDAKEAVGFSYAISVLRREQLRSALMEGITLECKERKIFKRDGIAVFQHWARHMLEDKRQLLWLRHEVESWQLRWKLMHLALTKEPESIWEKKDRLDRFWSDFHDRSRVLENGPLSQHGLAAQHGFSEFSPSRPATSSTRPGTSTTTVGGWGGSPSGRPMTGASTAAASRPGTAWGDPLAEVHEEVFGMRWDFDQATQWKKVDSRSGTNAQRLNRLVLKQVQSGLGTESGGGGSGLHKSASLPSLAGRGRPSTVNSMASSTFGRNMTKLPPLQHSKSKLWKECDARHIAPMPIHFLTGNSQHLVAINKGLTDSDLIAMAAMVGDVPSVEEVNLYDNMLLTDKGMVQMMKHLSRESLQETLQVLNLGRCSRLGAYTLDAMVKMLKSGGSLLELNLSQVPIATRFQLPLCKALGNHPSIKTLNLAETGMQPHDMTVACLRELLASKTLASLDIGWNNFDGKVFKALGAFVIGNTSLRKLLVANCAATSDVWGRLKQNTPVSADDFVPPLSRFLEQLAQDTTLTHLDISMNRCDFRSALILEDALDTHKNLRELTMCHNPLGALGIRSIMRLMSRDHTGLMFVATEGCYTGENNESGGKNGQVFSYTNPGGHYDLQLWRPYHRSLLRMLYKTVDYLQVQPDEAFKPPDENSKSVDFRPNSNSSASAAWTHVGVDGATGIRQLPKTGDLRFIFDIQSAIFNKFMQGGKDGIGDTDYAGFLRAYYSMMRFTPGVKKVIPLCARWTELNGDTYAQQVFLTALSRDFNLTLPILEYFTSSCRTMLRQTVCALLPSLGHNRCSYFESGLLFPTVFDYMFCQERTKNLVEFNLDNPTGHYKLDLANSTDGAVAERLMLLDRWEGALDDKHNRADISHRGNRSHIRNEVWGGRSLHSICRSVAEWKMPEHGEFEFDYMSNQKPLRKAEVLTTKLWDRVLILTYEAACSPEDKIAALRSISHNFFLTASHMRALIGYFKEEIQRANVFIIFYLRIVDMHNAKMFRVRFESSEEVTRLQNRLGYAAFFPFLQPENSRFELDLSVYDQRLCSSMYVYLCTKEKFPQNLHEYGYTRADGTEDPLPLGVPRSWADMKGIPTAGVFRAIYRCAPEDRNFACRKEMAQRLGFFDVDGLVQDEVAWWTGLMEPPEDVLNLLEFFISRYDNVEKPFLEIDGVDGNGCITLRELMEGLEAMDCHKFDSKKGAKGGATKEARIDAIFRYLDPGGEGSVSREEWAILDQLWKEFDLSIREFVHFLMLSFGDDLMDAWMALDEDEGGELDEEEWLQAVVSVGYFGPAKVVFALLDSSDDGNISFDEFQVLEKYKPTRSPQ
mmetsp:Transcript_26615/g.88276  ORF Transcript_26615/g.88276 Transcript_26615/m.88276 type:complete len:1465 (-) Transcript_26615:97-4491(-)